MPLANYVQDSFEMLFISVYLFNCDRVTGSMKTQHNRAFFKFLLLNIYNLLSQVYPLATFQLYMLITFGVTALQSSNNRKI